MLSPRPVPWPAALVVKKGSVGADEDRLRHAGTGVSDRDYDVLTGGDFAQETGCSLSNGNVATMDLECAAVGHGVAGVEREVEEGVLQLIRIDLGLPQAGFRDDRKRHGGPKSSPQKVGRIVDEPADGHDLRLERLLTGVGQEAFGEVGTPLHRDDGLFDHLAGTGIAACAVFHHLQTAHDDGKQIVEVVCDAAGQLPQRLELVCLAQARLGCVALRDIESDDDAGRSALEADGVAVDIGLDDPPIFRAVRPAIRLADLTVGAVDDLAEARERLRWTDVLDGHGLELFPCEAVVLDSGVVHLEEAEGFAVEDPGGQRVTLEQQTVVAAELLGLAAVFLQHHQDHAEGRKELRNVPQVPARGKGGIGRREDADDHLNRKGGRPGQQAGGRREDTHASTWQGIRRGSRVRDRFAPVDAAPEQNSVHHEDLCHQLLRNPFRVEHAGDEHRHATAKTQYLHRLPWTAVQGGEKAIGFKGGQKFTEDDRHPHGPDSGRIGDGEKNQKICNDGELRSDRDGTPRPILERAERDEEAQPRGDDEIDVADGEGDYFARTCRRVKHQQEMQQDEEPAGQPEAQTHLPTDAVDGGKEHQQQAKNGQVEDCVLHERSAPFADRLPEPYHRRVEHCAEAGSTVRRIIVHVAAGRFPSWAGKAVGGPR